MIERIFFSLQQSIKHRRQLKLLPYAENIAIIDWLALYDSGIRVVVLDFDGVLAADKQKQLHVGVDVILNNILRIFGDHVYIFSNQPTVQRKEYFSKYFPRIQFIVAKKKPYPDGLNEVVRLENVRPEAVILIDDRVLTGGLATILANVKCLLIKKPYVCFSSNILRELIFISLRAVERLFFR